MKNSLEKELRESLLEELEQPRFTIRDTEVQHRNITHWGHQGLLMGEFEEGKWRRLNYLEILWLRIVAHYRSFDIPLEKIRSVREAIGSDTIPTWSMGNDGVDIEAALDPASQKRVSILASMVVETILHRTHFGIFLTLDGSVKSLNLDTADQTSGFWMRQDLLSKTFLCVSLSEVMQDSFRKVNREILEALSVLTLPESEVVNLLLKDQISTISVGLADGRLLDLFELSNAKDHVPAFLDVIWRMGYQRITWSSRDGRVTYFDYPERFTKKGESPEDGSILS